MATPVIGMEQSLLLESLDALSAHVAMLGSDGEILSVNRAWSEFARVTGDLAGRGAPGANYLELCEKAAANGDERAAASAAGIRRVLAGEAEECEMEAPCQAPGVERWFIMRVRRVVSAGPVAAIAVFEDRTRRWVAEQTAVVAQHTAARSPRDLARTRAVLSSLADRSHELVAILDATGRVTYLSPSARRMLAYAPDDVIGSVPADFVHAEDRGTMLDGWHALLNGGPGGVAAMTVRLRRKDGSWCHVEGTAQNLLSEPVVGGIVCIARDVTSRLRAEQALRASEALHRGLVDATDCGAWAVDIVGTTTFVNPRMAAMLGCAAEDIIGRSFFDFMDAPTAFDARTFFARRQRGFSDINELVFQRVDGTSLPTLVSSSPLTGPSAEFVGALAMVTDITERREAEQVMANALAAADLDRRRLEATLDALPVGVWLLDPDGRVTHTNPAAARIWGGKAPHAEHPGDYGTYRAWWPETGVPLTAADWSIVRTLQSGATVNDEAVDIERFDGTRGHVLTSSAPIRDAAGRLMGAVAVNVDITERQAAARERERLVAQIELERARLAAVFAQAPAFLAVLRGPDYVFEMANPAYQSLVGQRHLIGRTLLEALPEIRDQGFIELLDKVRTSGDAFIGRHLPVQLARNPGEKLETRYVDFVYQPLLEADGTSNAIVAHGVDVTEQVLAHESLGASERRLREQFAKLPVPTFLCAASGDDFILVDHNEAAEQLVTFFDRRLAESITELFRGFDGVVDDCRRSLREGIVVRREVRHDATAPHRRRTLQLTIGPQPPDRVLIHAVDTTARQHLELQLRQAQKMEAVGRLAGGVAHDFNNLLTVIGAHSAFLLESLPRDDQRREDVQAIHKAGLRAAELTHQLLAFSRKQILRPSVLDLNQTVVETKKMLDRLIGEDIEIVTRLAPRLGAVLADAGQLEQVLLNLAVNARDAMPAGGRLTIETRDVEVGDDSDLAGRATPSGSYVLLCVTDSGLGMDLMTQTRIFEPFFTTKEQGKGTGLGLATVYGIVKQTGGYIWVGSTPGDGTTFRIFLPRVSDPAMATQASGAAATGARGAETVLIVEDDPAVREIAHRVLRHQGYVVLEARDGRDALALSLGFDAPIHLLLSDAVMPGMNAADVVREIRARRPAIKALYMSGYTDDEVTRRGIVSAEVPFVQKPFTPTALARAVREVLDGRSERRT